MSYIFRVPDEIYTELAIYASQCGQPPDALFLELVTEGLKHLKQVKSPHKAASDPSHDPLAPFIGAFDSEDDDPGWIERHDAYFVRNDGQE